MGRLIGHIGTGWWRAAASLALIVLYAISVSNRAYELTTPDTLPHHELVRKIFALLAFALLGFLLHNADLRRLHGTFAAAIAIALCSYAIEIGQIVIDHSRETFGQHAFDVASGLVGGALGAFVALLLTRPWTRGRGNEAAIIVMSVLALAFGYTTTYGFR